MSSSDLYEEIGVDLDRLTARVKDTIELTRLLALALLAATACLAAWSCSTPTPNPAHCIGPLTAYERATCEP